MNKLLQLAISLCLAASTMAEEVTMTIPDRDTVIEQLGLEEHVEGGYFRRTFQADHREKIDLGDGARFAGWSPLHRPG